MSTMSGAHAAQSKAGQSAIRWPSAALAVLQAWWEARKARRRESRAIWELRAMSERELKDIGICRSQIEWAVRGERERDRALTRCF